MEDEHCIDECFTITLPTINLHPESLNVNDKICRLIVLCWPWPGNFGRGARILRAPEDGIFSDAASGVGFYLRHSGEHRTSLSHIAKALHCEPDQPGW